MLQFFGSWGSGAPIAVIAGLVTTLLYWLCIGSFRYEMQEIDPRIFSRTSKIFFDSEGAVLSESGDFIKPLEQGIITEEDLDGDIGRVINGTAAGRENDDEIIIFKSVGVGAMDLMAAKSIYDGALEKKIGTIWG